MDCRPLRLSFDPHTASYSYARRLPHVTYFTSVKTNAAPRSTPRRQPTPMTFQTTTPCWMRTRKRRRPAPAGMVGGRWSVRWRLWCSGRWRNGTTNG
jgi:hypothetical protein